MRQLSLTLISLSIWGAIAVAQCPSGPCEAASVAKPRASLATAPQARANASHALTQMTRGVDVEDITLSGTATRFGGELRDSGSVTLVLKRGAGMRLDLRLEKGSRAEIYNRQSSLPQA